MMSSSDQQRRVPPAYYRTLVTSGHAPVNEFLMYYEIHGTGPGRPLVVIHPARATANVFPSLIRNRRLVALELRGHGRSTDTEAPFTFEQQADDIAALLRYLEIAQADFFGDSSGGLLAVMMAVRHPKIVGRVVSYGGPFAPRPATSPEQATAMLPPDSYPFEFPREGYERVASDPSQWAVLCKKVGQMEWNGFSEAQLRSIVVPVLIAAGDHDHGPLEQGIETARLIPNAQVAVIPGASHFLLSSDPEKLLAIVGAFLEEPETDIPLASVRDGYHPGKNR
jgi:pimeloyl-ACP methyl ester carboxylesterase